MENEWTIKNLEPPFVDMPIYGIMHHSNNMSHVGWVWDGGHRRSDKTRNCCIVCNKRAPDWIIVQVQMLNEKT